MGAEHLVERHEVLGVQSHGQLTYGLWVIGSFISNFFMTAAISSLVIPSSFRLQGEKDGLIRQFSHSALVSAPVFLSAQTFSGAALIKWPRRKHSPFFRSPGQQTWLHGTKTPLSFPLSSDPTSSSWPAILQTGLLGCQATPGQRKPQVSSGPPFSIKSKLYTIIINSNGAT